MLQIKCFTVNPVSQNSYLLYNEHKDCIVIDPGMFTDEEKELVVNFITHNQLVPKYLLNTHCHFDHVFANNFMATKYNLQPYLHANEKFILDNLSTTCLRFGIHFNDVYLGTINYLTEGQKIVLGNDELEVLFTPGHSPGSVSFYCAAQQFIIGGDVLFKESIGRTDLPGGDLDILTQSIKTQFYTKPNDVIVYAGHGDETTIGYEKINNGYVCA
jgi:hydroxyacylglutathione hydrolase